MRPPDLESTHKDASDDTHIIYFRQFQMCWNHPNNSPGSFDMDPKHHSNSPHTWAIHIWPNGPGSENAAHVQGPWSRSAQDLGHIPRPSQVHLGWLADTSLKSLLLVGTHIQNMFPTKSEGKYGSLRCHTLKKLAIPGCWVNNNSKSPKYVFD